MKDRGDQHLPDTAQILALTLGEPAGVGGELTLKSWLRRDEIAGRFVAIANADHLAAEAARLGDKIPIQPVASIEDAAHCFARALPVMNVDLPSPGQPGTLVKENAPAVINSIRTAVDLARKGQVDGIVTNPIHKGGLYSAGFDHPGHTEFLAELAGGNAEPVMMLACEGLRTVPVTTHLGLRAAIDALTPERIVSQSRITAAALHRDFGIQAPRLAVAGLNPHAGEDGAMGNEEQTIIRPAIEQLRAEGLNVSGPHPPDTLFSASMRPTYDAAVCMYHDQALIPIKTLDFSGGVNITLGLPFIRTSPDHGTALDIAGKGIADETSLIAALRVACAIGNQHALNRP